MNAISTCTRYIVWLARWHLAGKPARISALQPPSRTPFAEAYHETYAWGPE